ncbi:thiamine phosphate synthase [Methylonatrum kenyense]|uniref:thiamine phosphate synthase n=1 Tax=Methylonatrum kenyense TaxID=455253 RepID=UPI0020C05D43|nr:thiamine phosphate synthase [Methylonatrum kenyense]
MSSSFRGLYAITDGRSQGVDALLAACEPVLAGGARVLQYRDKTNDHARRQREAVALAALCRRYRCLFIVNDDPALALRSRADGVHLGRYDRALDAARDLLGPSALIGVSCYDSLPRAQERLEAGADYLAFGTVFASATKPDAPRASLDLLRQARARFPRTPLVAIGGIDADNVSQVAATGIDAAAVISGVFAAADPGLAARRISQAFDH